MANAEAYARWLVENQDKAGTQEFETVASAYRAARGSASEKASNPADDVGFGKAMLIGAGRATDKIVQGVRQAYNTVIDDQGTLAAMAKDEAEKDALYRPLREARPIATGIGEGLPMLAIPAGGAASTLGFLGRSALAGAVPQALKYGSAEDRAKGALVGAAGGALGGALGLGTAKLLKPAGAGSTGIPATASDAAERLGVRLTPGERTQNAAMMNFENYLARSPGSSGAMQSQAAAKQAALNQAAARSMGQTADTLDEGVFSAAKNAIGAQFDRLQQVTNPQLGPDFMRALVKIDSDNAARGAFKSKAIDSLVDKGLDLAAQGKLTGKAYKEIRSELSAMADAAFAGKDATLGQALKTVRAALDDAAKKSLTPDDQKAWDLARQQWLAYRTLTRGNVSEGGNVSAARVASQLRRGGDMFRTGAMRGDLADIARLGEAVKGVQNPNSGNLMHQMLFSSPLSGIPMAVGNKAISAVYNASPVQAYMSRGLLDVGPTGAAVLGKLAGPTGQPIMQQWLGVQ